MRPTGSVQWRRSSREHASDFGAKVVGRRIALRKGTSDMVTTALFLE